MKILLTWHNYSHVDFCVWPCETKIEGVGSGHASSILLERDFMQWSTDLNLN